MNAIHFHSFVVRGTNQSRSVTVQLVVRIKLLRFRTFGPSHRRDDRIHQLELAEREHKIARERAEKAKEKADSRAEQLQLELEVRWLPWLHSTTGTRRRCMKSLLGVCLSVCLSVRLFDSLKSSVLQK